MVGCDRCEDRYHCQLNISARKPLWSLLQALWNQPIRHLQAQTKKWATYSDIWSQANSCVWTFKYRFVCMSFYLHYHAAECRTELVQAARWSEQKHFVLQCPWQLVENQLQHLPICLLQEKNKQCLMSLKVGRREIYVIICSKRSVIYSMHTNYLGVGFNDFVCLCVCVCVCMCTILRHCRSTQKAGA